VITNAGTTSQDTTAKLLMAGTAWLANSSGMTITDVSVLNRLRQAELSVPTSHSLTVDSCATAMVASRILPRDDDALQGNQLGTVAQLSRRTAGFADGPERQAAEDAHHLAARRLHR
jgi:hypothetical protein